MVDGPNLYQYARTNPVLLSDPEGGRAIVVAGFDRGDEVYDARFPGLSGRRHTLSDSNKESFRIAVHKEVQRIRQVGAQSPLVSTAPGADETFVVESTTDFAILAYDAADEGFDELYFVGHGVEGTSDLSLRRRVSGATHITTTDIISFVSIALHPARNVQLLGCDTVGSGAAQQVGRGMGSRVLRSGKNVPIEYSFANAGMLDQIESIRLGAVPMYWVMP